MKYHVVIPSIGKAWQYTEPLVDLLMADPDCAQVEVPSNSGNYHSLWYCWKDDPVRSEWFASGRLLAIDCDPEQTIYESWNRAIDRAQAEHLPCVCLNDDVILHSDSIATALHAGVLHDGVTPVGLIGLNYNRQVALGCNPGGQCRYVTGTYRVNGLGGHAFIVTPGNPARVDKPFRWWYGDDWLVRRTGEHGLAAVVAMGAPVDHPEPSKSGNQMPWLSEACEADRALWIELTGLPG